MVSVCVECRRANVSEEEFYCAACSAKMENDFKILSEHELPSEEDYFQPI
ncbi:hypothetical protein QA601_04470 [Chitinispirillales bacterium ANBcel5]|nr:hypothetical protein [Chitinispirillales bacterium ANBcel5]